MLQGMIVPLIMAAAFTAGGILIQHFERHAARIEHTLIMALLCLMMFALAAMLGRYAEEAHTIPLTPALRPPSR